MGRKKREITPLSAAERVELLATLAAVNSQGYHLVMQVADLYHRTGSSADDLAAAMGVSRRVFYARLAAWRADQNAP